MQTLKQYMAERITNYMHREAKIKESEKELRNAKNRLEYYRINGKADLYQKKEKHITRIEKRISKLEGESSWTKNFLQPIADYINEQVEGVGTEILGPFGINCRASIWVWLNKEGMEKSDYSQLASLTFEPGFIYDKEHRRTGWNFHMVDYSKKHGSYPTNSIGSLNGCEFKTICVDNWTLDQLVEQAKKKERTEKQEDGLTQNY